jgi:hypothetical protein
MIHEISYCLKQFHLEDFIKTPVVEIYAVENNIKFGRVFICYFHFN